MHRDALPDAKFSSRTWIVGCFAAGVIALISAALEAPFHAAAAIELGFIGAAALGIALIGWWLSAPASALEQQESTALFGEPARPPVAATELP